LLGDRIQDGAASLFELAQVAQPHFQVAQHGVVQAAGGLFAVAGDEGHRGAVVEQFYGGGHLGGAGAEFGRQLGEDSGVVDAGRSARGGGSVGHLDTTAKGKQGADCATRRGAAICGSAILGIPGGPGGVSFGPLHRLPRLMLDLDISEFFAAHGPLAAALPGYTPRPAQVELAQAIGRAIADRATLVAEAGTGIGKTWAYLVPAFAHGGKVIISTGTRTLQDQLFARDLPRVRAALAAPVTAALLKGRANYVCHYHLDRLQGDERALKSRSEMAQLRQIQVFAGISKTGDRADLGNVPEDADIWQRVTSTRENCLGQECPRIRDCFVVKARRQAQDADVVVVNHALFMADLVLREEGVTDL